MLPETSELLKSSSSSCWLSQEIKSTYFKKTSADLLKMMSTIAIVAS